MPKDNITLYYVSYNFDGTFDELGYEYYEIDFSSNLDGFDGVTSSTIATPGAEVKVTLQPTTGYNLPKLYYLIDGDMSSKVAIDMATLQFTMPDSNVTIYAEFEELITYTITMVPNDALEYTCPETAKEGDTVTITFTKANSVIGFVTVYYTIQGSQTEYTIIEKAPLNNAKTIEFVMPEGNIEVHILNDMGTNPA